MTRRKRRTEASALRSKEKRSCRVKRCEAGQTGRLMFCLEDKDLEDLRQADVLSRGQGPGGFTAG